MAPPIISAQLIDPANHDYFQNVARGLIPGQRSINKFGRNAEVDATADVWSGGKATGGSSLIWLAPTAARTHNAKSDNAGDTTAGAGAWVMRVYGLKTWDDLEETSEDIILDGVNDVATVNEYVIIYRAKILTNGATSKNIGLITLTAVTDLTVTARIEPTRGQTEMAIYGISSKHTLYMHQLYGHINKSGGASAGSSDFDLLVNDAPDVHPTTFTSKHIFGAEITGNSIAPLEFKPPKIITGPAIVKVHCMSSASNLDIGAGFNGVVIDN